MIVEILPGYDEPFADGVTWIYVRTPEGVEGWIVKSLLNTTSPTPRP